MTKTSAGNFFEDFRLGQTIRHATPRTMTGGDFSLYTALFGPRFAVQSSAAFAKAIGYPDWPLDDLLVFHIVFGKTVPDVSLNAVANLGYAGMQFLAPVFAGDTLSATSEVIGLKENSNRKTGIVYVRTRGVKQDGTAVLEYVRWVMVRKRDEAAPAPGRSRAAAADRGRAETSRRGLPADRREGLRLRAGREPASLRRLCGRREDRPCRRHHRRGGRASDRDAALSEHRAHPFRPVLGGAGPLRQAADLRRPRHLAGARDLVQRPGQRLPYRRDQRRPPRRAAVCGRDGVCMVGGAGGERAAGARRRRRAAAAHRRHQGPALRGFPIQERRGIRPRRSARSGLLGADPAADAAHLASLR